MANLKLAAKKRTESGTSNVRRLRRQGRIPGIFYFHGEKNIHLVFDEKELYPVVRSETPLIDLTVGKEVLPCVIRDVQYDPVNGKILHIDLMGISFTEKLRTTVSVHLSGIPIGVKVSGGILQQILREVEIEVLPADLPEKIEVDVSQLNVNDHISIGDLKRENITFLHDDNEHIATVSPPSAAEVEPVKEAEETAEPEVITRGKAKEEAEE